jgi:hypothetical protein
MDTDPALETYGSGNTLERTDNHCIRYHSNPLVDIARAVGKSKGWFAPSHQLMLVLAALVPLPRRNAGT